MLLLYLITEIKSNGREQDKFGTNKRKSCSHRGWRLTKPHIIRYFSTFVTVKTTHK